MAKIIDGKAIAEGVLNECKTQIEQLKTQGINPCLALIRVGEDPASGVYVNGKISDCKKVGMVSKLIHLPETVTQAELLAEIDKNNCDINVHGILVQLPISKGLDEKAVIDAISPQKDADGFHPMNAGYLSQGNFEKAVVSCTPAGVLKMLQSTGENLSGKNAVVVGRSNIVGKPMALLLIAQSCTVTICHSRTANLAQVVNNADIVVAAVGKSEIIKGDWIKNGAIVIDVGMNRNNEGKLTGDVEFAKAKERAGYISPVPGGVGPMTRAMLLSNTVLLAQKFCKTH